MSKELKARVLFYNDYHIGCSLKSVQGYAIEIWDSANSEWTMATFAQINEDDFIHSSFLHMLKELCERGISIEWNI